MSRAPHAVSLVSPPGITLDFGSGCTEISSPADPVLAPAVWSNDLDSLGKITVGGLFKRWYIDKMYKFNPHEKSKKQSLHMCKMVVDYCKLFLPSGSVITEQPSNSSDIAAWNLQMNAWSDMLEERVPAFAAAYAPCRQPMKRKRSKTSFVTPNYKRLTEIDHKVDGGIQRYLGVQAVPVIDTTVATSM